MWLILDNSILKERIWIRIQWSMMGEKCTSYASEKTIHKAIVLTCISVLRGSQKRYHPQDTPGSLFLWGWCDDKSRTLFLPFTN